MDGERERNETTGGLNRSGGEETGDGQGDGPAVTCVSLEAEIPEVLFDGMRDFIRSHPHWDQYRLITSALAGFLFQNGCTDRCVTQHYLNGLFVRSGTGQGA